MVPIIEASKEVINAGVMRKSSKYFQKPSMHDNGKPNKLGRELRRFAPLRPGWRQLDPVAEA